MHEVRDAQAELTARSFEVTLAGIDGEPGNARGDCSHSRIRHLMIGSTTTNLLRSLPVPVLVLR